MKALSPLFLAVATASLTLPATGAPITLAVSDRELANDADGTGAFLFEVLQVELSAQPDYELVDRKRLQNLLSGRAKPVQVFILAGQSNMQGHAHVRTFDAMGLSPATAPILEAMRAPDGSPRVCDRVWISSIGSAAEERTGKPERVERESCRSSRVWRKHFKS